MHYLNSNPILVPLSLHSSYHLLLQHVIICWTKME